MPELPEVETIRRGLAAKLEGRRLRRVEQRRADLRFPLPDNFAERLVDRRVVHIGRRAKYLLFHLDDGNVWLVHLGMSGRLFIQPRPAPEPGPHDHVIVHTDNGSVVTFCDPRRFGSMDLVVESALDDHPRLAQLGPEPLGNQFNGPLLSAQLAGKATPIKAALLDQRVVAGLGNIYVCEALWRARVSPRRLARTIPGKRAERLALAIREVLLAAIAAGGSSLRDYVQADGELGYFQHAFSVYDRAGEPCRITGCAGAIARIVQSGRSTFFCPSCQR